MLLNINFLIFFCQVGEIVSNEIQQRLISTNKTLEKITKKHSKFLIGILSAMPI